MITLILVALFAVLAVVSPTNIVELLTPIIVLGAVELAKWAAGRIPGAIIVAVLVPVMSGIVAFLSNLVGDPGLSFIAQLAYGGLSVFVYELYKQLKKLVDSNA